MNEKIKQETASIQTRIFTTTDGTQFRESDYAPLTKTTADRDYQRSALEIAQKEAEYHQAYIDLLDFIAKKEDTTRQKTIDKYEYGKLGEHHWTSVSMVKVSRWDNSKCRFVNRLQIHHGISIELSDMNEFRMFTSLMRDLDIVEIIHDCNYYKERGALFGLSHTFATCDADTLMLWTDYLHNLGLINFPLRVNIDYPRDDQGRPLASVNAEYRDIYYINYVASFVGAHKHIRRDIENILTIQFEVNKLYKRTFGEKLGHYGASIDPFEADLKKITEFRDSLNGYVKRLKKSIDDISNALKVDSPFILAAFKNMCFNDSRWRSTYLEPDKNDLSKTKTNVIKLLTDSETFGGIRADLERNCSSREFELKEACDKFLGALAATVVSANIEFFRNKESWPANWKVAFLKRIENPGKLPNECY